jgi:hypothetical protein
MQEVNSIIITAIVLVIVASPFALILIGAVHRAKQRKSVSDAANKYLIS